MTIEVDTIHCGDCLDWLRGLPDGQVNTCVTSPPYWGLRDYGTAEWEGGDEACEHEPSQEWIDHNFNANSAFGKGAATQGASARTRWFKPDGSCPDCGAKRIDKQLGLEKTPEEYVAKMVDIFREVRRVLRDDGTLWLNLGDSYCGGSGGGYSPNAPSNLAGSLSSRGAGKAGNKTRGATRAPGLKVKDIVGIPWMVAFALRADGWYLRSDIIWHKPNPMPESVTDRPSKAHEYIFLMSKSAKYYYDQDAIREDQMSSNLKRMESGWDGDNKRGWPKEGQHNNFDKYMGKTKEEIAALPGRNKRTVWTVATKSYKEAHFATFPTKLIEPCVLAGAPEGGVVIDPFMGAGTVAKVAKQHDRHYIGCELNPEYVALIDRRLAHISGKVFDKDGNELAKRVKLF